MKDIKVLINETIAKGKDFVPWNRLHGRSLYKSCIPCLSNVPANKIEPLRMSKFLNKSWLEVSVDFCSPFPFGEYL